jgi:hypothetical protein
MYSTQGERLGLVTPEMLLSELLARWFKAVLKDGQKEQEMGREVLKTR